MLLTFSQQGFETRTGPYGPTGLTGNRSLKRFFKHKKPEIIFLLWTSQTAVKPHGFLTRTRVFRFLPQIFFVKSRKFLHEEQFQVGRICSLGRMSETGIERGKVSKGWSSERETYLQICYNLLENWGRLKMIDWEEGRERQNWKLWMLEKKVKV